MISLKKGRTPQILKDNSEQWTKNLMEYVDKGTAIPKHIYARYGHRDVKAALIEESNGKCMYCEKKMNDIAFEQIEHYRPKDRRKYPYLAYCWHNLGIVCPKCNQYKSNEFDETIPFVNPYYEEPHEFFKFKGAFVFREPGNRRAKVTEEIIQLNRTGLLESRGEKVKQISGLIDDYVNAATKVEKKGILGQIMIEIDTDKEFTYCARSLFISCIAYFD